MARIKILGLGGFLDISNYYRITKPFACLDPERFETSITRVHFGLPAIEEVAGYDILYATRVHSVDMLDFVRQAAAVTRVVLDYDDLMDTPGVDRHLVYELARIAHGVTGIVPEISELYAGLARTCAWHNGLNLADRLYRTPVPKPDRRILFLGAGNCDQESLDFIAPVLARLLEAYPDLLVRGYLITGYHLAVPSDRSEIAEQVPLSVFLKSLAEASITLVPYRYGDFPWGKGIQRLLQSAAWKVPSIYSPMPSAKRFLRESDGGVVVVRDNTQESWFQEASRLLDDPRLAQEIGRKAHETVARCYSDQAQAKILADFFECLMYTTAPGVPTW